VPAPGEETAADGETEKRHGARFGYLMDRRILLDRPAQAWRRGWGIAPIGAVAAPVAISSTLRGRGG
jgi:hypothetical protein